MVLSRGKPKDFSALPRSSFASAKCILAIALPRARSSDLPARFRYSIIKNEPLPLAKSPDLYTLGILKASPPPPAAEHAYMASRPSDSPSNISAFDLPEDFTKNVIVFPSSFVGGLVTVTLLNEAQPELPAGTCRKVFSEHH